MHVEFRLLGPLELRRGGESVPLRGAKLRALLVDLLLNRGEVVSVDRLIDDLWPRGAPAGARHAIETHASKLRAALGDAAVLVAQASGYVLDVDALAIDSVRFEQLLDEAREAVAGEPSHASACATEALALWRGPALADVAYESFAQVEIARLEELRLEAEEERVAAELALGRAAELVGELEALVEAEPLRERRRGQLMLALYRSSRQADALEVFRRGRKLLLDELGLDPGEPLRELERAILRHDPALAGPPPAVQALAATRRLATVVAVEPDVPLDLEAEEYDRRTRRAADAVARIGAGYGAELPEPFLLVFLQEDQAGRADAAAADVRETLGARVGVAGGEALLGTGPPSGPVVARARRRAAEAPSDEPAATPPAPEPHESPFLGRGQELARLRRARIALVHGPAGIGKSRLAREAALGRATAIGRCTAHGSDPLAPLHEIAAALGEPDALHETRAAELPLAFRRLCRRTARGVLVVLDDLQWADPLVLEALEQLAADGAARTRILCVARDDLLERRPDFFARALRIDLAPLAPADSRSLALALGARPEDVDRVLAAAEGNPLFIEQLVAHASEGGEGLPLTLDLLLGARLGRLSPAERYTIERAAVIGRDFDASLVAELGESGSPQRALAALERRGLVEPAAAATPFEQRFRFRHATIQEAAYELAPKQERSRLHERLADRLAARGAADDLVGFHLERAAELRPDRDRHARRLAEDAGRRLAAAGLAVWRLGYVDRTTDLLGRAEALLAGEDELRRGLLCELAIALDTAGRGDEARAALAEAANLAARAGDARIELRARMELAASTLLDSGSGGVEQVVEIASEAVPVFEAVRDERALGRAWMLIGWVEGGIRLRNERWYECATRALSHYRSAELPTSTCAAQIAAAAYFGPLPAGAGAARCRRLLEEADDLAGRAAVLAHLGGLEAMLGRGDDARERLDEARAIYTDLGRSTAIARSCAPIEADACRWAGDLERARAILLESCEQLRALSNWSHFGEQAAALAGVLLSLDDERGARAWRDEAASHCAADDLAAQLALRIVGARLLAREGAVDASETLARETVVLGESTDALNLRAETLEALAGVLASAGRPADATEVLGQALALYEAKENRAAADRLPAAAARSSDG